MEKAANTTASESRSNLTKKKIMRKVKKIYSKSYYIKLKNHPNMITNNRLLPDPTI